MTVDERRLQAARILVGVADLVETERWIGDVGALREIARRLVAAPEGRLCRGCGAALEVKPTGRPPDWCDDACRKRSVRKG